MRTVLVVARRLDVLQQAENDVRRLGFGFLGSLDDQEALAAARANPVDAVVFVSGVPFEARRRVTRELQAWNPRLLVIEPRGPGMVEEAVAEAFDV